MDAILTAKAERLAGEMATQARTLEDLNGLMRSMMKAALERMLNTELAEPDVFFVTDHNVPYPYVLLQLGKMTRTELQELLQNAWRIMGW